MKRTNIGLLVVALSLMSPALSWAGPSSLSGGGHSISGGGDSSDGNGGDYRGILHHLIDGNGVFGSSRGVVQSSSGDSTRLKSDELKTALDQGKTGYVLSRIREHSFKPDDTLLEIAAAHGSHEVFQEMLNHPEARVTPRLLYISAETVTDRGAKLKAALARNGDKPLHAQIAEGVLQRTAYKLPGDEVDEAFEIAVQAAKKSNVKLGASSALVHAIRLNRLKVMDHLIDQGADPNEDLNEKGMNVSHHARNPEILRELIRRGTVIQGRVDRAGMNQVHWIAAETVLTQDPGKLENARKTAEMFLAHGVDINAKDGAGQGYLHKLFNPGRITRGNIELAVFFLDRGLYPTVAARPAVLPSSLLKQAIDQYKGEDRQLLHDAAQLYKRLKVLEDSKEPWKEVISKMPQSNIDSKLSRDPALWIETAQGSKASGGDLSTTKSDTATQGGGSSTPSAKSRAQGVGGDSKRSR